MGKNSLKMRFQTDPPKSELIDQMQPGGKILQIFKYCTGKSLSEALFLAEHGENMLCAKIVLNVRNNFCTQHVLPRFELGIFM